MANLEFNMNQPNVLNAHRVAEGWLQVLPLLHLLLQVVLVLLPLPQDYYYCCSCYYYYHHY